MNEQLINLFGSIWLIKIAIVLLIAIFAVIIILKVIGKKNIVNKGLGEVISNHAEVRRHDKRILNTENNLRRLRKFIDSTLLAINSDTEREYLQYNVSRAGLRIAERQMTADEYNAICRFAQLIVIAIFLIAGLFVNAFAGIVGIICTIMIGETLPKYIIRSIVNAKDSEIQKNFSQLYLLLHYNMVSGLKTSIYKNLQACIDALDSKELKNFARTWMTYIDETGEQQSVNQMAKDYREIHVVVRLMRIVKQLYDGDDVVNELDGFRQEIVNASYEQVVQRQKAISAKATRSLGIVMIILVQAIISAMFIYFPDISVIGSLF